MNTTKPNEIKTKAILNAQESFDLDEATAKVFFNAMQNPNKPNQYLKQAAKNYLVNSNGNGIFELPIYKKPQTPYEVK